MAAVSGKLAPEDIAAMTPLEVMLSVMAAQLAAGELASALAAASAAAPYVHARKGGAAPETAIPAELQPDPDPIPDEPGPANPVH